MKNKVVFFVVLVILAALAMNQLVMAADPSLEEIEAYAKSECEEAGGTYSSKGDGKAVCTGLTEDWTVDRVCGTDAYDYVTLYGEYSSTGNINYPLDYVVDYTCGFFDRGTLAGKGVAKINSAPETAALGGTIAITGSGAPSFLRLKADGVTYKLPVIPGSVKQLPDGTFTAEFYTIDPVTNQPLVAPGDYKADVFGVNGPAGGQFKMSITR